MFGSKESVPMLPELKLIGKVVVATAIVGTFFGLLVGALAAEIFSLAFFLWMAGGTAAGAGVGIIFAYGFLPESGETEKS
jgi:ABC-type enterochelin transport system permease subunit